MDLEKAYDTIDRHGLRSLVGVSQMDRVRNEEVRMRA